jgi:hypothetical protein
MKNDAVLKLNQKPHTLYGIVSFIMAIASIFFLVATIVLSASQAELTQERMVIIGLLEWVSAMLTLSGFSVAIIGECSKDMEKIFAHISLFLHFFGLIYHGIVVWHGFIV